MSDHYPGSGAIPLPFLHPNGTGGRCSRAAGSRELPPLQAYNPMGLMDLRPQLASSSRPIMNLTESQQLAVDGTAGAARRLS